MGENGPYCENLQIFCGKMGVTLRQNPQKTLFSGPGGLWGGVLSHMSEEKWGKLGENGGKWGEMGKNGGKWGKMGKSGLVGGYGNHATALVCSCMPCPRRPSNVL